MGIATSALMSAWLSYYMCWSESPTQLSGYCDKCNDSHTKITLGLSESPTQLSGYCDSFSACLCCTDGTPGVRVAYTAKWVLRQHSVLTPKYSASAQSESPTQLSGYCDSEIELQFQNKFYHNKVRVAYTAKWVLRQIPFTPF